MIKRKQWVLLPANLVMNQPNLQLGPLGVVLQQDWRRRTISDYSYFYVNDDTTKLAPQSAMQFGKALTRILQRIQADNPWYDPVYMSKINVADAFYRINLNPADSIRMGVLFPSKKGERKLIGFPLLVLPVVLHFRLYGTKGKMMLLTCVFKREYGKIIRINHD